MKNLKRFLSFLLAAAMLLALGITAYAAEFTDVPAGSDYAEAVQWAADNGYVNGYGGGRFGVNDNVTRAQLATIFYRAAGTPAASGVSRFSDVAAAAYYVDAASWAEDNGLINGYPGGRFGVDDPVTRQQVATILWRWAGSPIPPPQIMRMRAVSPLTPRQRWIGPAPMGSSPPAAMDASPRMTVPPVARSFPRSITTWAKTLKPLPPQGMARF